MKDKRENTDTSHYYSASAAIVSGEKNSTAVYGNFFHILKDSTVLTTQLHQTNFTTFTELRQNQLLTGK